MESRRVQLLLPLLTSLNRSAFDNLHKQVSGLDLDCCNYDFLIILCLHANLVMICRTSVFDCDCDYICYLCN
jgi:hypothetical protein